MYDYYYSNKHELLKCAISKAASLRSEYLSHNAKKPLYGCSLEKLIPAAIDLKCTAQWYLDMISFVDSTKGLL